MRHKEYSLSKLSTEESAKQVVQQSHLEKQLINPARNDLIEP